MAGHNYYSILHDRAKMPATGSLLRLAGGERMFAWGTAVPTGAGYATGCLFVHTDGAATTSLYVNEGSSTSASFVAAVTSASVTLQTAFAAGNEINTADGTPKLEVGDGSDSLLFYTNSGVPTIATDGTSNLVIAPDGGGTTVTGTLTASGNFTVGSTKFVVTAASGALAMATGSSIALDTNKFTVDASGNVACAGTLASSSTITGTFAGTLATAVWNANPVLTVTATIANGFTLNGQTVTSGTLLYLAGDSSLTGGSGNFIRCYNDTTAATPFTVASDGAVTIGGTAAASALTVNAGDVAIGAGGLDIIGAAVATDLLDITRSNTATGGTAIDIAMGSAAIGGNGISIAWGGAGTGDGVVVNMTNNVAGGALVLTGAGSRTDALVDIVDVPNTGAETIYIAATAAHNSGHVLSILDTGAYTNNLINLAYTGNNATGDAISVTMTAAAVSAQALVVTGKAAATAALVSLTGSGASGGDVLYISNTAGDAAANSINITNAGTAAHNAIKIAYTAASTGDAVNIVMTNAAATANAIDITSAAAPTVPVVSLTTTGGDEGVALQINSTAGHDHADCLEIKEAGTAANNLIALNYSAAHTGDAINILMTNAAAGAQGIVFTSAVAHTSPNVSITSANGAAATLYMSNGSTDAAGHAISVLQHGAGSNDVLHIAYDAASTGDAINILMTNAAVTAQAFVLSSAVAATNPTISVTTANAAAATLYMSNGSTDAAGHGISILQHGAGANAALNIAYDAASTGDAIAITMNGANVASQALTVASNVAHTGHLVDISPSAWVGADGKGILNITAAGNLVHANASCLLISYSGAGAASGLGTSLRIVDTGATATSFAVYVSAATGEALVVDAGACRFDETVTFRASNSEAVAPNYVQAGGGPNDITVALHEWDGTTDVALADGLELFIDLAATQLQAGANNINLNGGGNKRIYKSSNPAADKAVAVAAGGVCHVIYSSGAAAWLDLSE